MRPTPVVVLVLAVVFSGALATGALGSASTVDQDADFDADDTVLSATVDTDGDAAFAIEYRIELDDDADRDAFDELAAEMEANESAYLERFEERFAPTVEAAAAATDREMHMEALTVSTDTRFTDRQIGVVRYAFTWTAFAAVDGGDLYAGDALGGLILTEDMRLDIAWPETHMLVAATPSPDTTRETSVSWRGPIDFATDEPRIHVSTDAPSDTGDGFAMWLVAGGLLVILAVVAGGWYVRTTRETVEGDDRHPDTELLSNEEQVLHLVRDRGGRMKQQEVAEALGWTDAKTSKVVGRLREAGDLEAFRLGRENVLRLPEEDEAP